MGIVRIQCQVTYTHYGHHEDQHWPWQRLEGGSVCFTEVLWPTRSVYLPLTDFSPRTHSRTSTSIFSLSADVVAGYKCCGFSFEWTTSSSCLSASLRAFPPHSNKPYKLLNARAHSPLRPSRVGDPFHSYRVELCSLDERCHLSIECHQPPVLSIAWHIRRQCICL